MKAFYVVNGYCEVPVENGMVNVTRKDRIAVGSFGAFSDIPQNDLWCMRNNNHCKPACSVFPHVVVTT